MAAVLCQTKLTIAYIKKRKSVACDKSKSEILYQERKHSDKKQETKRLKLESAQRRNEDRVTYPRQKRKSK